MSQPTHTELLAERRRIRDALKPARQATDKLEEQKQEIERQLSLARTVELALERDEDRITEQIERMETRHVRPVADSPQA
ncbi:hypothetical protein SEA_SICARIUS2_45 [Arthrobacter phage Sicarius2]|uniref:Uncharacterized protein n=2 Tax=Sicariusvirus TaxID=3425006 RepID=A0A8F3IMV4_9CAUD|nr:hypothetical protein SEA_SICARIUS2_45 [Arthrobacter phage Sicarius2]WNM67287.1 hypothetical protein SEA_WYBORN_44 [Arthrobacter phage Wyborn]